MSLQSDVSLSAGKKTPALHYSTYSTIVRMKCSNKLRRTKLLKADISWNLHVLDNQENFNL